MVSNYVSVLNEKINVQTYIVELFIYICFNIFLLQVIHSREMRYRKAYNSERIVNVEIRRTEEMLSKLAPDHAITGIKNDSKVIDYL